MKHQIVKNKNSALYTKNLEDSLKSGYEQMSPINQGLAEDSVQSDNEALKLSEQSLRSVKFSDS